MYSRFNKNGNLQISNPDEVEKLFEKNIIFDSRADAAFERRAARLCRKGV